MTPRSLSYGLRRAARLATSQPALLPVTKGSETHSIKESALTATLPSPRVRLQPARSKLDYIPQWEGHIEGWAVNFINKNLWRVLPDYDRYDLYQELALIFFACKQRYPRVVDPPHFMTLFRVSVVHHVHSMAQQRRRAQAVVNPAAGGEREVGDALDLACCVEPGFDNVEWKMMLEAAPKDVCQLIAAALAATGELPFRLVRRADGSLSKRVVIPRKRRRRSKFRTRNGLRETTNEYLCRLAGLDPQTCDLRGQLSTWLCARV